MIYLDNAATSFPKAPGVAEAVQKAMTEGTGNPGRASHAFARRSADIAYDTRELLAGFLGAPQAERLCFTKNATEALNIALLGWIKPGMTVITSELEHNAVMRPLRWLERYRDVRIRLFRCAGGGLPDLDEISKLLRDGSDLLVCTAASNVTGFKLPIEAIARLCAKGGVRCGLDGSQLVGHAPLNLAALDLDFFCFPGHKGLLGPMGTGGIYLKPGFDPMPLILGGTGSNSEREYMPGFYPDELEAGTPNVCGLAGLKAALEYLLATGVSAIQAREEYITDLLARGLEYVPGLRLHGHAPGAAHHYTPAISVGCDGFGVSGFAHRLDREGVAVRMGLQCAPAAHRALGTVSCGGTLRFSPGFFTTEDDVRTCVQVCQRIMAGQGANLAADLPR
ncbi:MAG: hypothetical protein A2087_03385 [Spirochaetes bacterium GWD1_61_31]|nr:MAG: hypothetical protein A2Y37_05385 [Spirochaetes bacterium GWB1_60_80]OHD34442.1 MAG: hypothetical protein A2004_10525 [Spirochaetes bacterium GWC1_61_12]OHD38626.1 MAG: hypothetical protein A2087_03385 [Spirochaetes bacterium GWD1_61_31]OHD43156.1 MAG: hypothetical protein A2Y35_01190 [Spirochaetes bacterium GWE1_60_18]OHD58731.1 MAG: hypothetical protein A2Y32_01675 [Spirochaetes bacterium GWF1_60_12]HAP43474.1 cysteine desulfurase [Spirochaetaceae bacterium]